MHEAAAQQQVRAGLQLEAAKANALTTSQELHEAKEKHREVNERLYKAELQA